MEDIILWLKYLFLGFVQGATEPIPVSSSLPFDHRTEIARLKTKWAII